MYCALPRDSEEYWSHFWNERLSIWQQEGVTKFYDLGHRVIGVEFVEECVRSYFTESELELEEATCPIIKCKILRTPDHRLQVFICNIFYFKRECAGTMDIVWDRSGFTAMRVEDRARYAAVIKSLLAPDFSYGMWTVVYDTHSVVETVGPRSAGESALREHFGDTAANIALVDSHVEETALYTRGGGPFTFCLWHMTPIKS
ncbi:thiopurine S-methyltransferase-like isoform X2 [Dermacentor silvarum]|uniref:thiopurine S-methyltransferase-like isoform X2 n=1 Tax=Dermacentor silvarum TaxID=543639 RepID=UPI0021013912|nr:thiopurine S-methyltransferase-like isoform X2 [Dermacentor silvarum]